MPCRTVIWSGKTVGCRLHKEVKTYLLLQMGFLESCPFLAGKGKLSHTLRPGAQFIARLTFFEISLRRETAVLCGPPAVTANVPRAGTLDSQLSESSVRLQREGLLSLLYLLNSPPFSGLHEKQKAAEIIERARSGGLPL